MLNDSVLPPQTPLALKAAMTPDVFIEPHEAAHALEQALRSASRAIILTGAGLSTESGIPDFRSPGGLWSRMEPITFDAFCASEDARREDWRRRFEMAALFAAAAPNAAHRAIAHLAAHGPVDLVVTQNIDGLHARAGTPPEKLMEIHGTAGHAHCLDCRTRHELDEVEQLIRTTDRSPRCRECGGLVKAAIVSFGEPMPQDDFIAAQAAVTECDLLIAAGTSLVVYPVAALPLLAHEAGARIVIASSAPTQQDGLANLVVRSPLATTFAPLEQIEFA